MEDRFKFRGVLKLDTQNIVIYSSFLKNYDDELVLSVSESDGVKQIKDAGYKLTDKDWDEIYRYSDQDDYYPWFDFSCERVDQCTGLKDKNGKLIYEGDILRSESYPFKREEEGTYNYAAEVCFDKDSAVFFYWIFRTSSRVAGRSEGNTGQLDEYEWEVIGNIHENADLLGEE